MRIARVAAGRTFASLRIHRNYRLYFSGQIASLCGTWMATTAAYWLILDLTGSPFDTGLLSLTVFGPYLVFGLVAGVVADRFDLRRTVIATQVVQLVFSGLLAGITLLGTVVPWEVFVISAAMGSAAVFELPARQAMIVQLVGRSELPNAIALNSSIGTTARLVGPALGGIVIAAVGAGWCFAVNSVSFLAVIVAMLAIRVRELYPLTSRTRPSLLKGTREAMSYVRHSRPVLVLIGLAVVMVSFAFNVNVLLPVLVRNTLRAGPQTLGAISACFGAGALVGALTSAAIARPRWRRVLVPTALVGVAELLVAPLDTTVIVGALLVVCGACFSTFSASSNGLIQLETPDYIRGRVLGLYFYAWNAPVAVGSLFLGWLCATGGTRLGFAFGGLVALAATAVAVLVLRRPASVRNRPPALGEKPALASSEARG